MATIEDVALRAGVSVATVSRVINNNELVTREKIDKVQAAMDELGYRPNTARRKTQKNATKMIMVVTSALVEDAFRGIRDTAKEIGYDVMTNYIFTESDEKDIDKFFNNGLFDGVIITNCFISSRQLSEISENYNSVECGNCINLQNTLTISIDDELAAYEITAHLIQQGKRRIAFTQIEDNVAFSAERKAGYFRALYESGLPYDPGLIIYSDYSYESGVETAKRIMTMENRPDAVVCIYDMIAAGCLNTLNKNGIRVPEDIAVTGFDNLEMSEMVDPKITTVAQPFYELGAEAVRTLKALIDGDANVGGKIILDHKLLIRGSSKVKKEKGQRGNNDND